MHTSRFSQRADGFTVLEALVSFSILSISLVATNMAVGLAISSIKGATSARDAQRVAAELFATLPDNCTGEQSNGVLDGRKWQLHLAQVPAQPGACKVQLDIYDEGGRQIRSYVTFQARTAD